MRAIWVLLLLTAPVLAAPRSLGYLYVATDGDVQVDVTLNDALIGPGIKLQRASLRRELLKPDWVGAANHLCFAAPRAAKLRVVVTTAAPGQAASSDKNPVALRGGTKDEENNESSLQDSTVLEVGHKPACVDFTLAGYDRPAPGSKEPVSAGELRDYGMKLLGLVKSKSTDALVAEWQLVIDGFAQAGVGTPAQAKAQFAQLMDSLAKNPLVAVAPADIHGRKVGPGERYALVVGASNGPLIANAETSITPIVEKRNGVLRIVESR